MKLDELAQEYKTRDSQMQLLASQLADPKSEVKLRINPEGKLTAGLFIGRVHFAWVLAQQERQWLAEGLLNTGFYHALTEHRVWVLQNS